MKYARLYLADASGNKLADKSALSVTYGGNAAVTVENANGYYVYDGGNNLTLANITATVNGAAGSLDQYRIVCLLSTSTGIPAAGPVIEEPNWDQTYTYSFTYPLTEIIVPLNAADLVTNSLELKYHDAARNQLGHSQDSEVTSYYGRWYVRNKNTGLRQPLMFLVHTVLCDIDCRDELDAVRQCAGKGDGGVRFRLGTFFINHHIKVTAIYFINMVVLKKSPFCRVEFEVCAPIVHGATLC